MLGRYSCHALMLKRALLRSGRSRSTAAGILAGLLAWISVGGAGFLVLRTGWLSYALAEPTKSYTLPMLLTRLAVGIVCTVTAGAVSALIAQRSRAAAWWLGSLLLLISAPIHLWRVWADYPPWYHFGYLIPLMPLTIFGGLLVTVFARKRATQVTPHSADSGASQR